MTKDSFFCRKAQIDQLFAKTTSSEKLIYFKEKDLYNGKVYGGREITISSFGKISFKRFYSCSPPHSDNTLAYVLHSLTNPLRVWFRFEGATLDFTNQRVLGLAYIKSPNIHDRKIEAFVNFSDVSKNVSDEPVHYSPSILAARSLQDVENGLNDLLLTEKYINPGDDPKTSESNYHLVQCAKDLVYDILRNNN